ncbi:hypothetical protein ACKKBG_A21985 [Auxenochlorella protothecoides x Auxenochlorella symbiontica]
MASQPSQVWLPNLGIWAASHLADPCKTEPPARTIDVVDLTLDDDNVETAAHGSPACCICLEVYGAEDKAEVRPCHHTFCSSCILQWLELQRRCPLCNQTITKVASKFVGSKPQTLSVLAPPPSEEQSVPGLPAVLEDSTPLLQRLHAFFEHERYSLGRRTTPAPPPRPRWGPGSVGHARRQPPPPAAGPSPYFQRLQRHARSMRQPATPAAPGPPPAAGTAEEILGWRRAVYAEGTWTRIQWPLQERGVEPRRSRAELRAWVLRELQVLLPGVDCTLILTLVLALFGTPGPHADAIRALDCFLGTRTAHFWHELRVLSASPLSLPAHDHALRAARTGALVSEGGGESGERYAAPQVGEARSRLAGRPLAQTTEAGAGLSDSGRLADAPSQSGGAAGRLEEGRRAECEALPPQAHRGVGRRRLRRWDVSPGQHVAMERSKEQRLGGDRELREHEDHRRRRRSRSTSRRRDSREGRPCHSSTSERHAQQGSWRSTRPRQLPAHGPGGVSSTSRAAGYHDPEDRWQMQGMSSTGRDWR